MNTFFKSQFNYCLLVWIYCNRSLNTKIDRLHERCLRIVYNNKKSSFNELQVKDGSVSIHHQNLQKLAVELFKVSWGLSPEIVNELFQFREQIPYELRQRSQFQIPWVYSVFSGTEALKFLGPKVWALDLFHSLVYVFDNCHPTGWRYRPVRMRNISLKTLNFRGLSLSSILYLNLIEFSDNREKKIKLDPCFFNLVKPRGYNTSWLDWERYPLLHISLTVYYLEEVRWWI